MAATDWQPARLRAARALTPDIRLLEIEPASPGRPPRPAAISGWR